MNRNLRVRVLHIDRARDAVICNVFFNQMFALQTEFKLSEINKQIDLQEFQDLIRHRMNTAFNESLKQALTVEGMELIEELGRQLAEDKSQHVGLNNVRKQ